MTRALALILVAAISLSLAGCARKASPSAPQGAFYPRTYPEVTFPPGQQGDSTAIIDDSNPNGPMAQQPENRSIFDSLKHPEAGATK